MAEVKRSEASYSITVTSYYPMSGSMTVGILRDFVQALDDAAIPDAVTLTDEHNHQTKHLTALRVHHTIYLPTDAP